MKIRGKLVVGTGIVLILGFVSLSYLSVSKSNTAIEQVIKTQLEGQGESLYGEYLMSQEVIRISKKALDDKNKSIATAIASLIHENPVYLDQGKLVSLAVSLRVDEIHITDGKGIIQHGNIFDMHGKDLSEWENSSAFLTLIGQTGGAYAQEPTIREVDGNLYQYIGVSRTDDEGLVVIGFQPRDIQALLHKMDVQSKVEQMEIGGGGFAMITDSDGTVLHHKNSLLIGKSFSEVSWAQGILVQEEVLHDIMIGSTPYYIFAQEFEDVRTYVAYPQKEIRQLMLSQIFSTVMTATVSLVILLGVIALVIGRWVTKPLGLMEKAMERVGQGDFTAEMGYRSKDEIGLASIQFGVMTENIRRLIKGTVSSFASVTSASDNVMNNVEGLLSASREVTKAVEEIAEGAMETATGVNERLSAGQDLGKSIQKITGRLSEAQEISGAMVRSNTEGRGKIGSLQEVFRKTVENTGEVAANVEELRRSSKSIENILGTIKGIADQTNLLALNASIEAA
ncbi:methyl-accepting chemotaxis protein, partial [Proteiniclasticum ruminis]